MYRFEILSKVDPLKWNDNLLKSEHSTFFQTSHYLKKSGDTYPVFINVYDENKAIVGQLGLKIVNTAEFYASPILLKLLKLIKSVTRRAIWIDGPIIHLHDLKQRDEVFQCIMQALEFVLKSNKVVFLYGYSPPRDLLIDQNFLKYFEKNNYQIDQYVTYITDLTKSVDEIWSKVQKYTKTNVKRAAKRGIIIKELKLKEELQDFVKLHQQWGETKGLSVIYSSDELQSLWDNISNGTEKIFFAFNNDKIISSIRISIFNNTVIPTQVLNSYSKSTSLGGPALTWRAITWAKESNMKIYDITGGTNPENTANDNTDSSLVHYKRKWGGDQIQYYKFFKIVNPNKFFIYGILMKLQVCIRKNKTRVRPNKSTPEIKNT